MAAGAIWTDENSGSTCGSLVVDIDPSAGIRYTSFGAGSCGYPRLTGTTGDLGFVLTGLWASSAVWSHVAIVVNDTTANTYVNGALARVTAVNSVNPYLSGDPFRLGTDGFHNFHGQISDLAMWNRALAATEVSTIRASGVRALAPDSALIINLRADEGTGSTIADASGRGHAASLQGSARWSTSCPARP